MLKSFILIAIVAVAFSQFNGEYVVGGLAADLTTYDLHKHSHVVGNTTEFNNTIWIAPGRDGMLIANVEDNLISYVDFRGANHLHTLKTLTRPVMLGENAKGDWYAACHGHHVNTSVHVGSGIAIGVQRTNYTVYEHEVPAHYKPNKTSQFGQEYSKLEAVNDHAFRDDYVIALDAGWDHIYHWGLAEWRDGLQIIHSFERGFGPHSMAFSRQGFLNVLGEYDPAFAVLAWNNKTQSFAEIARHQIHKAGDGWTGGDILVNRESHIFVSLRHQFNNSGYINKYEFVPGAKGQDMFKLLAYTAVGDFPTRLSMSQDEERIIVCNTGGDSVEVLSARDLKKIGGFMTGTMKPLYAHEIRHSNQDTQEMEGDLVEEIEEIIAEEIAHFLA